VHASADDWSRSRWPTDRFAGSAEPLVALALDEKRLSAPVRREPADPAPPPGVAAATLFPHVYGPVELSAVTEVRYARRDPSGRYTDLDPRPATAEALDLIPHHRRRRWYCGDMASGAVRHPAGYPASGPPRPHLLPAATGAESCWHSVRSDEMWLWHSGDPLALLLGGTGPEPADDRRR